jgi:hypothetical protein
LSGNKSHKQTETLDVFVCFRDNKQIFHCDCNFCYTPPNPCNLYIMLLTTRSSPASLILSTCTAPSSYIKRYINTVSVMCLEHSFTESLSSHSVISRHKQCHSVSFPTTFSVSLSLCVQTLSSLSVGSNSVDTRCVYSNSDTQSVCKNPSSSTIFEREGNRKHPSRLYHFDREGKKN